VNNGIGRVYNMIGFPLKNPPSRHESLGLLANEGDFIDRH